jgi:glycosyltransferase involved in cell wall biosynthesis
MDSSSSVGRNDRCPCGSGKKFKRCCLGKASPGTPLKTICYSGFLGGPRSMGRVGYYLVSHLLTRSHYRVYFYPWHNDYMAGHWGRDISKLVIEDPSGLDIDQSISFCSVLETQEHFARWTTAWLFYELSTLPRQLARNINRNDEVYVMSEFVRRTFLEHSVVRPMTVLGVGFDPRYYRFFDRARDGHFIFLCVAEHTPRKNLPTLVRCFEQAFQNDHDVRLVLKLGLHGEGDIRRYITQADKVTLFTEEVADDAGLAGLYQSAHCFVLPTRGEAFGMPILEAMATGLPVIVTNYSGHLDFCTEANSFLIRNKSLVDSDPTCFPYVQGKWGDPDEDHLIYLMRYVYENYERALDVGREGYGTVSANWTWEKQLARAFP